MKLLAQKRLAGDLIFWFFFIKKKERKAMIKPIPISVRPFFLSKKEFLLVNQKIRKQGWEMSALQQKSGCSFRSNRFLIRKGIDAA